MQPVNRSLCAQEGQWSELMLLLNSIPLFLGGFLVSILLQVKTFSGVFNVLPERRTTVCLGIRNCISTCHTCTPSVMLPG